MKIYENMLINQTLGQRHKLTSLLKFPLHILKFPFTNLVPIIIQITRLISISRRTHRSFLRTLFDTCHKKLTIE
jgi:hypothetical protein